MKPSERERATMDSGTMDSGPTDARAGPTAESDANGHRGSSDGPAAPDLGDRFGEILELLRAALADVGRMRAEGLRLARLRADRAKVGLRRALFVAALGATVAAICLAAVAAGAVAMVLGLAGGLSWLLDGPAWLGLLLAGLLVTALALGGVFVMRRASMRALARELEDKYRRTAPPS